MGEMGDRRTGRFRGSLQGRGARFYLGRTGMHHGYRAGTQNGSGISEEAATGKASQRKLKLALRREPDANALTILKS